MKPLNIDKTGCANMSSNCVVWQGPDIECISLCKGDSVTEVIYKLATELCTLMDTFNLTNYDLKCFSGGVCQPKDFKDFLNILIAKVCALQTCTGCADTCNSCAPGSQPSTFSSTFSSSSSSSNPDVPIAPAFFYTNQFGDQVTTMPLDSYVNAIGNKVSNQVTTIQGVNATLAAFDGRITNLENKPAPTMDLPQIVQDGSLVNMDVALQTLNTEFNQLQTATGDANAIYTNMQKMDPNLSNAPSLAAPGAIMSSLPGWVNNPSNQAESFGNMWKTIMDMRTAVKNMITNYVPSVCSGISIVLNATYDSGANQITLYFTGTIPADFGNMNPGGTPFLIRDSFGSSFTTLVDIQSVINNVSGFTVPLTGTPIVASGNLFISANPAYKSRSTGSECVSSLDFTIVNTASCPAVIYTPTTTTIQYGFTTESGTRTYSIELWDDVSGIIVSTQSFTTISVQTVSSVFGGLTTLTPYRVRVLVSIGGVITTCPFTAVTTL